MKKVIAGCIDLMLEFDSASELDRYIADIEAKKQEYSIVDRKELQGDRIMIRIHRQYNKSPYDHGQMLIHLEEFLSCRSISKVRKLIKLINRSDNPDIVNQIKDHIQYRMEGLDNITMITENRIDRNKAEVKDAEMNVQHWLYLRSQHKKGSNGYKHYMTNVKESRDTLKEKKADLRSAEKEYKDSIRDKEFFSKLLSEVFS